MAEQQTPTFKLVLVGDGGTGKVRSKVDVPEPRRPYHGDCSTPPPKASLVPLRA